MMRGASTNVVLVTCSSLAEAREIALAVVEKRLAACVNIVSAPVESVYRWKGRVETCKEFLLMIKTTTRKAKALETEVSRLHGYDVPEFLVLGVAGGSAEYLKWLRENA
jgi:periplasmic divalent cation tolerance protein